MIPPTGRLPVQGNCHRGDDCDLWFCGKKGEHTSYGTVPWEVGVAALNGWRRKYGSSDFERDFKSIFNRGGFGHYEMSIYTGSEDWRISFRPSVR